MKNKFNILQSINCCFRKLFAFTKRHKIISTAAILLFVLLFYHATKFYGLFWFKTECNDISVYVNNEHTDLPKSKYMFNHIPTYGELNDAVFVDFYYLNCLMDTYFFHEGVATAFVGVKYSEEKYAAEKERLSDIASVFIYEGPNYSYSAISGGIVLKEEKLPGAFFIKLLNKLMLYSGDHVYRSVMYSDEYNCIYYVSMICRLNDPQDHKRVFEMARDGLPLHTDVSEFAEQMEKKYRDSVK